MVDTKLSTKEFEHYKTRILAHGMHISRVDLCKVFPLFKPKTLNNRDSQEKHIARAINFNGKKVFYVSEEVVEYIRQHYYQTESEVEKQERVKKEREKERERVKAQYPAGFHY